MSPGRQAAALARLVELARLRREAELARLARIGVTRTRLQAAVEALRQTEAPLNADETVADPALVRARIAHQSWSEGQQRRLNQQLALVTADFLRQKPAAARAFGRAAVLEQLRDRANEALRAPRSAPP